MALDQRTLGEKVSDAVARFGGSWKFIFLGFSAMLAWVIVNSLQPLCHIQFDPYPFILLNLFLSLIAAFQAPFIMMSQNRTEVKQDRAYRELFAEIKSLLEKNMAIEKKVYQITKRLDEKLPPQN